MQVDSFIEMLSLKKEFSMHWKTLISQLVENDVAFFAVFCIKFNTVYIRHLSIPANKLLKN
jgi:hypothetical protein